MSIVSTPRAWAGTRTAGNSPSRRSHHERVLTGQRFAAHERSHDRLLNVEAILGFVPDAALWSLDDVGGHFLAAVRRQAVEKDRLLRRALHELRVDGEAGEGAGALLLLLLLSHRRPDVGVDDVGAVGRLQRVAHDTHLRRLLRALEQVVGRLVALRAG